MPKCDDGNACTIDTCINGECFHEWSCPEPADRCQERACVDGECEYQPKSCDDGDACTQDSCNPATGDCVHVANDCDDNKCTDDSCDPQTGACVHEPKNCDDNDPCTDDSCAPETGECAHTPTDGHTRVVQILAVSFGGDLVLGKVGSDGYENDAYGSEPDTSIVDPVWERPLGSATPSKSEPVCCVRGSGPSLRGTLVLSDAPCPATVDIGASISGGGGEAAWLVREVTLSGSQAVVDLGTPQLGTLADVVANRVLTLTWMAFYSDGPQMIGTTSHRLFLLYSAATGPSAKRIEWATTHGGGGGESDDLQIVRNMHRDLVGHFGDTGLFELANPWVILDGINADCESLSTLLSSASLAHLGLPGPGVVRKVYAQAYDGPDPRPDCTSPAVIAGGCIIDGEDYPAALFLMGSIPNTFEACFVYTGVWFMGGIANDELTGCGVLCSWSGPQVWFHIEGEPPELDLWPCTNLPNEPLPDGLCGK